MTGAAVPNTPLLELDDVARAYGRRQVLDGATLTLGAGTVAWLGGRNGSGKTTLLRVAVGLLAPQRGSVRLAGLEVDRRRREFQRRLGYVPAGNGGLYARLSVEQHLRLWLRLALIPPSEHAERLAWAYDTLALGELSAQRVDRLSTGQRQRVRLALGFLHRPQVVLLDEPLVSLDEAGAASLARAVEQLTARGGAVLLCSPIDAGSAFEVDDRVVLDAGRLVPVARSPLTAARGALAE